MYPAYGPNSWGQPPAVNNRPRERASTGPSQPMNHHLPLLAPAVPSTVHRNDLFFTNAPPPSTSPRPPPRPPHSYSSVSAIHQPHPPPPIPVHYLHRSRTEPPPIPPKPAYPYSNSPPTLPPKLPFVTHHPPPFAGPGHRTSAPPPPTSNTPSFSANPDELRAALELSKSEADRQAAMQAKLSNQEDEELARALQESMREAKEFENNSFSSALSQGSPTVYSTAAGSSGPPRLEVKIEHQEEDEEELSWSKYSMLHSLDEEESDKTAPEESDPPGVTTPLTPKASLLPYDHDEGPSAPPSPEPAAPQMLDDEALARQLAAEEAEGDLLHQPLAQPEPPDIPVELFRHSPDLKDLIGDEAFARKLAAEEEAELLAEEAAATRSSVEAVAPAVSAPTPAVSNPTLAPHPAPEPPRHNRPVAAPPAYADRMSQSSFSSSSTSTSASGPSDLSRNSSYGSASSATSYETSPLVKPIPIVETKPMSPPLPSVQESIVEQEQFDSPSPPASTPASPPTSIPPGMQPVTANQFVDQNLLRGVSIGFKDPSISIQPQPMEGPMPNIIQLPYGRCSPLHLQAPSWRHLLKLLAWLSGTRMEPSVEALAVTKADSLYLRTVIQFVKPHPTSIDWKTVLWFTLDHPVPPSLPNVRKYTNGDVDVLPWSYTLSSLPLLLRGNTESAVSKTYTIPAVEGIPFPPLPISFPSLAMYLNAVLETSRRYMNDSSSGVRKLAKMVDSCYPNEFEPSASGSTDRGVGKFFKKVVGRNTRNRQSGRGNEDTYELVTPFVADQY